MTAFARAISGNRIAAALALRRLTMCPSASFADNPIVQTNYTADPAPLVYDGRLYLYTAHDEDVTVNNFFTMNDWRVYSTVDMVNWTDHGSPAELQDLQLGDGQTRGRGRASRGTASSISTSRSNNSTGSKIGVAVVEQPHRPVHGRARTAADLDGNAATSTPPCSSTTTGRPTSTGATRNLWYVKLNADMISYPGSPTQTR